MIKKFVKKVAKKNIIIEKFARKITTSKIDESNFKKHKIIDKFFYCLIRIANYVI
jgi:hypothetical protein